jgi:hypothetical protein
VSLGKSGGAPEASGRICLNFFVTFCIKAKSKKGKQQLTSEVADRGLTVTPRGRPLNQLLSTFYVVMQLPFMTNLLLELKECLLFRFYAVVGVRI